MDQRLKASAVQRLILDKLPINQTRDAGSQIGLRRDLEGLVHASHRQDNWNEPAVSNVQRQVGYLCSGEASRLNCQNVGAWRELGDKEAPICARRALSPLSGRRVRHADLRVDDDRSLWVQDGSAQRRCGALSRGVAAAGKVQQSDRNEEQDRAQNLSVAGDDPSGLSIHWRQSPV